MLCRISGIATWCVYLGTYFYASMFGKLRAASDVPDRSWDVSAESAHSRAGVPCPPSRGSAGPFQGFSCKRCRDGHLGAYV